MNEPTDEELDIANEIVFHETDHATCKKIARALADARVKALEDAAKVADMCASMARAGREEYDHGREQAAESIAEDIRELKAAK